MTDTNPSFGEPLIQALKGAVIWQVLGVLTGVVFAMLVASHGSLMLVGVGATVGLADALGHGVVSLSPRLSQLSDPRRAVATWLTAVVSSLIVALAIFFLEGSQSAPALAAFMGGWITLFVMPSLPLAFLVTRILRRKNAA